MRVKLKRSIYALSGFFIFLIYPLWCHADGFLLRGTARIVLTHPKGNFSFDQAVAIKDDHSAIFETLDDFGNTILKLDASGGNLKLLEGEGSGATLSSKRFKKILSLPLTQKEFIAILLYEIPSHAEEFEVKRGVDQELVSVEKKSRNKKNSYQVFFKEISLHGNKNFPGSVEIVGSKSTLRLSWKDVELSE
jgi:hypothetical protein